MKTRLTKTQVEGIANSYLTQCFNNGTYGNVFAAEYIYYLQAEQYILMNY